MSITSPQKQSAPPLPKKNTARRMMVQEEKNRISRIAAAQAIGTTHASPLSDKPVFIDPFRPRSPSSVKASAVPDLILSIPPNFFDMSTLPGNERIGAFSVPEEASADDGNASDVSSICHSPTWDDPGAKKARKLRHEAREKKKKEKERAEKEAKQKPNTKRLVKSPPNHFSKRMTATDRSSSVPAVPTMPISPDDKPRSMWRMSRVRRSIDATAEVERQRRASQPPSFERVNSSRTENGFIGGLKLREANAGSVLEKTQQQIPGDVKTPASVPSMDRSLDLRPKSNGPAFECIFPDAEEQQNSPTTRDDSSGRWHSSEPTSPDTPNDDRQKFTRPPLKTVPHKGPPVSYRGPETLRSHDKPGSYVENHRQQNNQSMYSQGDEVEPHESNEYKKSHSRGRSWSIKSFGRRRNSSQASRDSDKTPNGEDYHDFVIGNYNSPDIPVEMQAAPQAISTPVVTTLVDIPSPRPKRFSQFNPTNSSFFQKKNAAKTALRNSYMPPPPPVSDQSSQVSLEEPPQFLSTRPSTLSSRNRLSKAERILGARVTSPTPPASPESRSQTLQSLQVNSPEMIANHNARSRSSTSSSDLTYLPESKSTTPSSSRSHSRQEMSPPRERRTENEHAAINTSFEKRNRESVSSTFSQDNTIEPYENWNYNAAVELDGNDTPLELEATQVLPPPSVKKPIPNFSLRSQAPPIERQNKAKHLPVLQTEPKSVQQDSVHPAFLSAPSQQPAINVTPSSPIISHSIALPNIPEGLSEAKGRPGLSSSITFSGPQPVIAELQPPRPIVVKSTSSPQLNKVESPALDLSFLPKLKHQSFTKPSDAMKGKGKAVMKSPPPPPRPVSILSNNKRQSTSGDPVAKMLVICCSCRYYHDLPSKLYECMANADNVVEDKSGAVNGVVSTAVKCPWCSHGMTTKCCEGYTAVVYLKERLH